VQPRSAASRLITQLVLRRPQGSREARAAILIQDPCGRVTCEQFSRLHHVRPVLAGKVISIRRGTRKPRFGPRGTLLVATRPSFPWIPESLLTHLEHKAELKMH
jgi:hypothetical protein